MARSAIGGTPKKTYPFIRTYCKMMGSYPYYIHQELQGAQETNAPADAYASKGSGRPKGPDDWHRVSEMDQHGRERIERLAGYKAAALLAEAGEAPADVH
jgi:hypothetical protein